MLLLLVLSTGTLTANSYYDHMVTEQDESITSFVYIGWTNEDAPDEDQMKKINDEMSDIIYEVSNLKSPV